MIYANTSKSTPDTIIMLYSGIYLRAKLISRVISPTTTNCYIQPAICAVSWIYITRYQQSGRRRSENTERSIAFRPIRQVITAGSQKAESQNTRNGTFRCLYPGYFKEENHYRNCGRPFIILCRPNTQTTGRLQ